jgi:hypothetical protein
MATGAEFASFQNKMLVGFQDIGGRTLGYLKSLHRESVQAKWDKDGVFNTRLTLTGSAVDTVKVNGSSKSTDGAGHLFDLASISSSESKFENANAVVYYVGFFYAEVPLGIRINPRNAKPEYTGFREEIGRSGSPDTVVANGNGTITFKVNSVTEAGVSNVGRTVVVYKNTPAGGAVASNIAIEQCTVAFASGDNSVTTVGALGQSPVSTTASDYTVVLLGASVARNTDLRAETGCFFIGTVTGNGAGNIPAAFSNADQFLFKTFEDASQIAYVPSEWLTATNVQDAIDEFLDGLLAITSGASGSKRIGVYGAGLTVKGVDLSLPMTTPVGGVGNIADSTLTASPKLNEVLTALDQALRRIRVFTATVGDGSRLSDKDATTGPNDATKYGGSYFFRKLHNSAATAYTITNPSTDSAGVNPYILGEESSPVAPWVSLGADRTLIKFDRSDNLQYIPPGKYQRVFLDSTSPSESMFINGGDVAPGGIFEDVLVRGGNLRVEGMDVEQGDGAVHFRSSIFEPIEGATRANVATLLLSDNGTGHPLHAHFENCIFYGPLATQVTPTPEACVSLPTMGQADLGSHRPLTFDNCVFIGRRTDIPVLLIQSGHHVVFNNCYFSGVDLSTTFVISAYSANCVFNDCTIVAPGGQALNIVASNGALNNCQVINNSSYGVVADPVVASISGGSFSFRVTNLSVMLGDSSVRPAAATNALIILGSGDESAEPGNLIVDGLNVSYANCSALHAADTIVMYGNTKGSSYSNVVLDCFGVTRTSSGTAYAPAGSVAVIPSAAVNCIVSVIGSYSVGVGYLGRALVHGLKIVNCKSPASNYSTAIVGVAHGTIEGLLTQGTDVATGGAYQFAAVIGEHGTIRDYAVVDEAPNYWSAVLCYHERYGKCHGLVLLEDCDAGVAGGCVVKMTAGRCELLSASLALGENGWVSPLEITGGECLVAGGYYSYTGTTARWELLCTGTIIRDWRGVWDGTTNSLIHVNSGAVNNLVLGNAFRRSAGASALVLDGGTGTVIAGNTP